MSLTKEDVSQIRDIVIEGMELFTAPIHEKLDEHSRKLDEHGRILHEHSQVLDEHSKLLRELGSRLTAIESRLGSIEERLDWIEGQIQAILNDVKEPYDLTAIKLDPNFENPMMRLKSERYINTLPLQQKR